MQQRHKSAPTQTSAWGDPTWSSTSFLGGSPYNVSMSEYLNVGSQQSQNSQLNTPPFPQRSNAPAAAGSASQLAAGTAKDDSTAASPAGSPVKQATSPEVDTCSKKTRTTSEGGD